MAPPGEIRLINRRGHKFSAYFTGNYNFRSDTYQYRVQLPDVRISAVVINVDSCNLRKFIHGNKPIKVGPPEHDAIRNNSRNSAHN